MQERPSPAGRTSAVEELRTHLDSRGVEGMIGLLAAAWDHLVGSDDEAMAPRKLARLEDPEWNPPILKFVIERHGALMRGSTRAELRGFGATIGETPPSGAEDDEWWRSRIARRLRSMDGRMPRFPRWRVLARVEAEMGSALTGRWSVALVTGLLSAFVTAILERSSISTVATAGHHAQPPSWGHTLIIALVAGAGVYVLVGAAIFGVQLGRYRLSGFRDPVWRAVIDPRGNQTSCELHCTVHPPVSVAGLGHVEAIVKRPAGDLYIPPNLAESGRGLLWFFLPRPVVPGDYEVRWYGTTGRRKQYEITRRGFVVPDLCGEGQGASATEGAGELGEDGQVGAEPHPIQPTNAEGE